MAATNPDENPEHGTRAAGRLEAGGRWLLPVLAALLLLVFRDLAGYVPDPKLGHVRGAERWFFVVSETSPYLIYLIFGWMLVARRRHLEAAVAAGGGSPWGAAIFLLPAAALYGWSYHVGAPDLLIPSLGLTLLGCGAALGGGGALRTLRLPTAFLVFAIPLPAVLINSLVFPLQLGTAQLASTLLRLLGFEVTTLGDFIFTEGQLFQVIETCSGLRGTETLLMASVLYVDLFYRNRLHAAVIVLFAPLIAFLINGLRVATIALNPLSEIVAVHTLQGVVALVLGVLSLALLDRGLRAIPRLGRASPRRYPSLDVGTLNPAGQPRLRRHTIMLAVVLSLLAVSPLFISRWPIPDPPKRKLDRLVPLSLGPWRSKRASFQREYLGTVYFDDKILRRYQVEERADDLDTEVTLFAARHFRITRRNSLISDKTAYPGSGARLISRTPLDIARRFPGEERAYLTAGGAILVHHWYEGVDSPIGEIVRSLFALDRGFVRRPYEVRMYRISTPFERSTEGRQQARKRLRSFARSLSAAPAFDAAGPGGASE